MATVVVKDGLLTLPKGELHLDSLFPSEKHLVIAALELGAESLGKLSRPEITLAKEARQLSIARPMLSMLKELIVQGGDPLGEAFCKLRSSEERRVKGAIYTPIPIVQTMVDWASTNPTPTRIVDLGVGSARFLTHAASAFPKAELVGIDVDPLATLLARANLAVKGYAKRARILLCDYQEFSEQVDGRTLYIGNPPYVRHHNIPIKWKEWLFDEATKMGLVASKLAGLHYIFFLRLRAEPSRPISAHLSLHPNGWM